MGNSEQKNIKAINKSLNRLPKRTVSELGVEAIQYEDNVFYSGNNSYKKIYALKPSVLGNKKHEFIRALCTTFNNKMRLTACLRNKNGKLNSYMFLTAYFYYESYYEASEAIKEFEYNLKRNIASILNITITECNLETVLTYVHMNCTGELKEMDTDYLFEKNGVSKIYTDVDSKCNGCFSCASSDISVPGRYGIAYVGKDYPEKSSNLTHLFFENEGTYQFFVEFQKYSEDELSLYKKELNKRYCNNKESEASNLFNMSYSLLALSDKAENLDSLDDIIMKYYNDRKILIMPGAGREKDIYLSSASLGLREFHSMQNASLNVISNLLL